MKKVLSKKYDDLRTSTFACILCQINDMLSKMDTMHTHAFYQYRIKFGIPNLIQQMAITMIIEKVNIFGPNCL